MCRPFEPHWFVGPRNPDLTVGATTLRRFAPPFSPERIFLSYFVGVILTIAGVCLLVNKKARTAATSLGLTILLTVLWIYLPMLLAAPTDVVALNFFFDTLLFCGAILLLANSIDKMKNKVGTLLIANRKIAG